MGNPMLVGMAVGASAGALTNRKDPLKGALMGGALGAGGGAMMGAGAGTGGGFAGGGFGSIGTAGQTAGGAGSMFGGMSNMFNNASIPSSISGLGQDISAANKWMNQNPVTSQIGFKLAQELMQQPPQSPMPGASVRQGGQMQPVDYMSLLNPQQQTVIRPATPSLI